MGHPLAIALRQRAPEHLESTMNTSATIAQRKVGVVLVTTGLSRTAGGPFFSVSGLGHALSETGECAVFIAGCYGEPFGWADDSRQWESLDLQAHQSHGLRSFPRLAKAIDAQLSEASSRTRFPILHVSGLWDAASLASAAVARRTAVSYAVSPRGMLEPWALQYKAHRKRLAMLLWQRRVISAATLLHATSELELQSIRAAGFRNPVAVIPNGIDCSTAALSVSHTVSESRRCVFLSRIHPIKGLPLLLEAWARLRPPDWTLEIAGHIQDQRHAADLRRMIASHQLDGVSITGERNGPDKWAFLAGADLFVLPSYSENFGIVVAEAMAAGVAVITTTGTPWQVLAREKMGWCVEPSADGIATALAEALVTPRQGLAERGARSRHFAEQHFGWAGIGRRMLACYRWMTGSGAPPADIVFD